jgi:hypothetical protein
MSCGIFPIERSIEIESTDEPCIRARVVIAFGFGVPGIPDGSVRTTVSVRISIVCLLSKLDYRFT